MFAFRLLCLQAAGHEVTGTVEGQGYPHWAQYPLLTGTDPKAETETIERMMNCDAIVVEIQVRRSVMDPRQQNDLRRV